MILFQLQSWLNLYSKVIMIFLWEYADIKKKEQNNCNFTEKFDEGLCTCESLESCRLKTEMRPQRQEEIFSIFLLS